MGFTSSRGELGLAPPLPSGLVRALVERSEHGAQLAAKCLEVADLLTDLPKAPFEQLSGVPAWTRPAIADVEEFLDLPEAQAHALRALDEADPLRRRRGIPPVAGGCPFRRRQQPQPFVIAQCVGTDPSI
jgi:hypothetical protein